MDVDQRLLQISQMRKGLLDLGVSEQACGNLLAALYFCDGALALPVVFRESATPLSDAIAENQADFQSSLDRLASDVDLFQATVSARFDTQLSALSSLGEALTTMLGMIQKLLTERGGTHETISDAGQEEQRIIGAQDESVVTEGPTDNLSV